MSVYETHVMKDAQLPFIFHASTVLPPHRAFGQSNWHENVEILYITDGAGIITSDTHHLHLCAGETAVINSNCLHTFATEEQAMTYRCLIVDRAFCQANYFDTNRIRFTMQFYAPEIGSLMDRLADEYADGSAAPYRTQVIRAYVLQIMAILCRDHTATESDTSTDSHLLACIKQAIGFIRAQSERDLSLDDVSRFVGLSKFYFAREFRRVTGYTFVAYVNLTRCEKAKVLLAENRLSVGDVGRACGFENQSYFTRTFRAHTGVLPSEYRRKTLT